MEARLYRMVKDKHVCPFGIKAKDLLEKEGYTIEDHHLKTVDETEEFKNKFDVSTTPQIFINDKRIGGYDDLVKFFGKKTLKQEGTTYQPIIAVFAVTFLMAVALVWSQYGVIRFEELTKSFVAISMCVLSILKLRDLYSFSNQFISYDLLAKKFIGYSYVYPFAEAVAGIGMMGKVALPVVASISIFIGLIGAVSVVKAVYIEKRDIKCACVGGDSNVPLGFISLTENLMMLALGIWTLFFN